MSYNLSSLTSNFFNKIRGIFRAENGYFFRNSFMFNRTGAVWIDTNTPREIYDTIPQVKTVVDRKAAMFSNMELFLIDIETGEKIQDEDLIKLLNNPNLLQSQNEWLMQYKQQEQIYGNQFLYKNKLTLDKYPKSLVNLSPAYVKPITTGKFFDQVEINGIIERYEFFDYVKTNKKFTPDSILWSRLTDLDSLLVGLSPIMALKYPISNIHHAYSYRNVIMSEKGAIGILSNESKDSMGPIAINSEDKKKIENEYLNQYGIGEDQRRVILTEASLKWQPMTYPTKDLMLFEEVDANTLTIIDAFGLNINMFSNKSATFENVKQSLIGVYENTIQPEADLFTQKLGEFIGIPKGTQLIASFEHLKILQKDKVQEANSIATRVSAINQMVSLGILSTEQALLTLENLLGVKLNEV